MKISKRVATTSVLLVFGVLNAFALAAELDVIHHEPSAKSALRYYDSVSIRSGEKAIPPLPDIRLNLAKFNEQLFPIKSTITPGPVKARTISAPGLVQPMFLIGYDQVSLDWLSERSEILAQLGATGLVVNVPDIQAMRHLQQVAGNLTLSPVNGDAIAENLKISHYPVLVTRSSIEQ